MRSLTLAVLAAALALSAGRAFRFSVPFVEIQWGDVAPVESADG